MIYSKCHVRKNDKVRVISGKDKGKIGKVLRLVNKRINKRNEVKVVVENINLVKKHSKPSAKNKQGGIVEIESPMYSSKLMLMCNKCLEPVRPKVKTLNDGQKVRVCRKCDEII